MKLDSKQDLNVLYQVFFFGRLEKQDDRPGLWLTETYLTSQKPLDRNQGNLTGSKILMSSTKFVLFGPFRKTRWSPLPLIGWDILDFSSESTEWNSTKLGKKSKTSISFTKFVFLGPIRKTRWPPWPLIGWDIFDFFEPLNSNLTGSKNLTSSTKFVFFWPIRKTRWLTLPLIGWDILDFSSETTDLILSKLKKKEDLNVLY